MSLGHGTIAIMGSGETTDSMVRVHRDLLEKLPPPVKAVFIDTPAGFQMNADDLFDKAKDYFQKHLNQPLARVSFKSLKTISTFEAEKAYQALREANYIFVGPGSPTYALKHWIGTPIPRIISGQVKKGGCFVAASAAALTLGRFTLPVYEIYKVGEKLHWVEGLNLLGEFGLPIVVSPHWNNAEGGTHDTRFCYMGEPRLIQLETLLPPETPILGVDEHTACILDFSAGQVSIKGIGGVTLRRGRAQKILRDGEVAPFEEVKAFLIPSDQQGSSPSPSLQPREPRVERLTDQVKSLQKSFDQSLKAHDVDASIDVLINCDKMIWESCREFEDEQQITQAREVLRGMIVQLGLRFEEAPGDIPSVLSPVMEVLLKVRDELRSAKQWRVADQIRQKLSQIGIVIEDTPQGSRWYIKA